MSLSDLRPWIDGSARTLPLLVLHATEACDSRCIGCSYGRRAGPVLDRATAESLAREADTLRTSVILVTGGEPLTVPHLEVLLTPFVKPERRLYLATSGTLLAARADLVARLFCEVFVSLDGPDAATHDALRGVPTFSALREGVAAVKERSSIPFTARTTVQRANIDRIAEIVETSRSLGIDWISFLPVDTWSSAFGRDGSERLVDLLPSPEQVERLAASQPHLDHLVHHFRGALKLAPYPPKSCNTPMVSAVVEADGTVRPCFFKKPIGHLRDGGLQGAIDGPVARKLRMGLDTRTDPECLRCVCPKYFPIRHLLAGKIR